MGEACVRTGARVTHSRVIFEHRRRGCAHCVWLPHVVIAMVQGFNFEFTQGEDKKSFETYNGVNVRCRYGLVWVVYSCVRALPL